MVDRQVLVLQPETQSAGVARRAVAGWLIGWDLAEVVEAVMAVASELVANAVVHAATLVEVSLVTGDGGIELTVRDYDRRLPRRRRPTGDAAAPVAAEPSAVSGRGLIIVDALADDWGVVALSDGKRIWARWAG